MNKTFMRTSFGGLYLVGVMAASGGCSKSHADVSSTARCNFSKAQRNLTSDDSEIRLAGIRSLGLLGYEFRLRGRYGRCELVSALRDSDPRIRESAGEALLALGPDANYFLPPLLDAACDPNPQVRCTAYHTLELIVTLQLAGSEAGPLLPTLPALIRHDDPRTREYGILLYADILPEDQPLDPQVAEALHDPSVEVRCAAAGMMVRRQHRPSDSQATLLDALTDANTFGRRSAAVWLGYLGHQATHAVPALLHTAQNDEDGATRQWALDSLIRLGPAAKQALPPLRDWLGRTRDPRVLGRLRLVVAAIESDVPYLLGILRDSDNSDRWRAAEALGALSEPQSDVVPALIDAMQTPRVPGFASLWRNEDPFTALRVTAADALGRMGPDARVALPALRLASAGDDELLRRAATSALRKIVPQS